jgi:hypothetical protein
VISNNNNNNNNNNILNHCVQTTVDVRKLFTYFKDCAERPSSVLVRSFDTVYCWPFVRSRSSCSLKLTIHFHLMLRLIMCLTIKGSLFDSWPDKKVSSPELPDRFWGSIRFLFCGYQSPYLGCKR